ncbi:hypothetical protein ACU19_05775 [Actinobaculum suis]|nr:hypothetical protein ACU19_05775 [Actinobaculum suis]OCA95146.1 hypothetical protein ACU20_05105 [Actinobaculum suis]
MWITVQGGTVQGGLQSFSYDAGYRAWCGRGRCSWADVAGAGKKSMPDSRKLGTGWPVAELVRPSRCGRAGAAEPVWPGRVAQAW